MALPASGQISMSEVNVELGYSSTAQISLNDSAVRTLFGISSGAISLNDGHGKSNAFLATISSNQQQLNLRTWALANGWNGTSAATITVASGVYIWSDSTATAALTIDGSWPGGITLVNNGFIMGKGGDGGVGVPNIVGSSGGGGGHAVSLGANATISSASGYIGGGGGGGGCGGSSGWYGGGGGGGAGGGNGGGSTGNSQRGAGGGRIMPGANSPSGTGGKPANPFIVGYAGAVSPGGYGDSGGGAVITAGAFGGCGQNSAGASSGTGTSFGLSGADSGYAFIQGAGGGGGGWGGSGGSGSATSGGVAGSSGGVAGKAVAVNGYTVIWAGGFPSGNVFGVAS